MGNSENVIAISQEDFGTLCICALRYCFGRRSYMPSLIRSIVKAHFKDLDSADLLIMADDGQWEAEMGTIADTSEEEGWRAFYKALDEYINGKAKKERGRDTETVVGSAL